MKSNLKKPCNDCPFRRNSIPGWLGPWSANDLLWSLGSTPFPCHQTIPEDGDSMSFDSPDAADMELCAGAAMFLNNKIERSRAPETAAHQDKVRGLDSSNIFSNRQEFIDHHEREWS